MRPALFVVLALTACDGSEPCTGDTCPGDSGDAFAGDPGGGDPGPGDPGGGDALPPDRPVVRVHYDTGVGSSIAIRGNGAGMAWDSGLDCVWGTGNVWVCVLPEQTGAFEVKPLLDDVTWARGANWIVGATEIIDIYPHFHTSAGRIEIVADFSSTVLGNSRPIAVYLPPSYDENPAKRYPVLIAHDGQNLFDAATSAVGVEWQMDEAMNALVETAAVAETILVGPYNTGVDRIAEYTPTVDATYGGGDGDAYLNFVASELMPWVDATYRTTGGLPAIGGSSLGGLISLYACWTRPAAFDRCLVMSPSLWWDEEYLVDLIQNDTAAKPDLIIYLDSGDSGNNQDGMALTATMRDILVGKGFVLGEDLDYVLGVGHSHEEAAWQARLPGALEFLLADPGRAVP